MWTTPDVPYQDLPQLPPNVDIATPAVFKATVAANRALARLDGAWKVLPDPTTLINLIPLLEAQASNEIESIVTTNDELFRAAHTVTTTLTPQVKEALRYREALRAGFESLADRPITTRTAIEICSRIHNRPARLRDNPGTRIGTSSGDTIYTPPQGLHVIQDHMSAWERFLHGAHDFDPLLVMAMTHYQFEAIHPFFDGNGRTGRVLNMLVLIEKGLLKLPILYLSGHIMRHKDTYYQLLNRVTTHDDWEAWILFILNGVESTAKWTFQLIDETDKLRATIESRIREANSKLPAADLTRLLFTQPYLRIDNIVQAGLAQRQTASRWLRELADRGIIQSEKVGRSLIFMNTELLSLLFNTPLPE